MVILDLKLKVISQSLQELRVNPDIYTWIFTLECTQCKSPQPNEIYFSLKDQIEMTKGHGTANFMMSCKECKKTMYVSIFNAAKNTFSINLESGYDEGVLAQFDCRGCIIKSFIPKEGIAVVASDTGTVFENVDITDVWMDYDEAQGVNCSILEPIEVTIEKNHNY